MPRKETPCPVLCQGGHIAQLVECLPNIKKYLDLFSCTAYTGMVMHACNPVVEARESEDHAHPRVHNNSKLAWAMESTYAQLKVVAHFFLNFVNSTVDKRIISFCLNPACFDDSKSHSMSIQTKRKASYLGMLRLRFSIIGSHSPCKKCWFSSMLCQQKVEPQGNDPRFAKA